MNFKGIGTEVFPVWKDFIESVASPSGTSEHSHLSFLRDGATHLEYELHIPQSLYGIVLERESDRKRKVTEFQQTLRDVCKERGWEVIDQASLQERLDVALSRIRSRGFSGSAFDLDQMPESAGYGVFINGSHSTIHNPSAEKARKTAIEYGSTGRWTVEEVEQFANDPENSAIFARAMNEMGFRPHKKQLGQWVKK
ncbi:MAG: hypothetical protein M1324_03440 [Patescibacteria group bacterium]|nr:hypothetical protein [Patescibacteria group bacterium]